MKDLFLHFWIQFLFPRLVTTLHILLMLVIASAIATGQVSTGSTDGATPSGLTPGSPTGSYPLSDFDTVNLYNGSLNFQLPLLKVGGRGGAGYPITLHVEKKWTVYRHFEPGVGYFHYADGGWWSEGGAGWRVFDVGKVKVRAAYRDQPEGTHVETLTRITFSAPDGTEYELRDQITNGQPKSPVAGGFNRGKVFVTSDGSAATFISDVDIKDDPNFGQGFYDDSPTGYMMLRDGTRFYILDGDIQWMRDRNGNKVSFSYDVNHRLSTVTDSLNRQITFAYPSSTIGFTQITYKGFGGAQRTIKIGQTTLSNALRSGYTMQTIAQLFPELHGGGVVDSIVVNYIELPDGRRFDLQYNPYAELARVVLPTGGAIEYDHAAGLTNGAASGVFSVNDPTLSKYIYRRVVERRVYPDGATGTAYKSKMTYSRPETTTTNLGYVTTEQSDAISTLLSKSTHYFHGSARTSFSQKATHYSAWSDGREYQTELFDTNGTTVLKRINHTFDQRAAVSWWTGGASLAPPNDPRLTESVTTLTDANQVFKQTFGYDDTVPYNNQNSVKEYHFGSGTPGVFARETKTTFVTSSSYTDSPVHLRSLPSQVSIYEGATERARTTFEYDNYTATANHALLTDRPNISGFDSTFTAGYSTRGNATAITNYLLTSGSVTGSISTYSQFDIAGNTVKAIDGRGYATNLYFEDCFGIPDGNARLNSAPLELSSVNQVSYAVPSRSVNALNHSTYAQFDYYVGKPVDAEDANGGVSSGYYDDALDRPTQVVRAVGTSDANQTTFDYDDTNRIITTTSDFDSLNDPTPVKMQTLYDMMGRTTETRQYEGGTNYIAAQMEYDALGRAFKTSNPFRPWKSETAVWTTTVFDALGRVKSVTTPDNAAVSTSYVGNTVTVTDQAGKKRKSVTDALGRLLEVYEDPTGLNYLTSYGYDVLDNLTTVTQSTQTRTFTYDSLKRLQSATNPESGTINYAYDNNGNLLTKTDARSISSTYVYDGLNRNTTVDYSNTTINPDITRSYDSAIEGVGRLGQSYAGGTETTGTTVEHVKIHEYDSMGRPKDQRQRFKTNSVWGAEYKIERSYNLAGSVIAQTYPSGRTITYGYDQAGRTNSFTGNLGDSQNRTYATGITYSPFGGKRTEQFGTNTPVYHKLHYNIRGQLYDVRASNVNDDLGGELGALVNHYTNLWSHGGSGPDNNGNVLMSQTIIGSNFMEDRYSYDALNRLKSVEEWQNGSTNTGVQTYDYDRWGNRIIDVEQAVDAEHTWGTGINNKVFTANPANNRLEVPGGQTGTMTYDGAGNLTTDTYSGSAVTRVYDAENRMLSEEQAGSVKVGEYWYNADGQRVRRKVNGTNGVVETWQIYGMDGELLAEYAANSAGGSPQKEYGYRNGELLITAEAGTGGGGGGPQNVTWQNAVGVSVAGNSLTKTASIGWGNAGASSVQTIASGDGYVEFVASETTTNRFCGLSNGDSSQHYNDVDFAFHPTPGGAIFIFEAGTSRGAFGSYVTGDVLRVAIEGGVVKYRKNGTLLYTSGVSPTYPLLADTSFYEVGSTVTSAVISGGGGGQGGGTGPNVALAANGGVMSASTSFSSQYPANEMNDGDRKGLQIGNTGSWADATPNVFPDWVQVDFNGSKTINEVSLFSLQDNPNSPVEPTETMTFNTYGNQDFDIQYWTGSTWATVPGGSVTSNNKVWRKVTFPAVTTTKVRVTINDAASPYSYATELEVYEAPPPPPAANVASAANGGVTSASTSYSSQYAVNQINNGDRKGVASGGNIGYWADSTGNVFPDWVQVDFNGSKTINEVSLFSLQDNPNSPVEPTETMTFNTYGNQDFDIQYWTGSTWATVPGGSVTSNNKVWRKVTFPAVTTTKVRVTINDAASPYSYVTELEVWGNEASSGGSSDAQINWLVTDHLGTPRMVIDQTGTLTGVKRHDYLPFGEELLAYTGGRTSGQGYSGTNLRQKFTSKERDSETGLDYFLARHYSSIQGRFTAVDPSSVSIFVEQPQSWNRYSYTLNNPLRFIDHNGKWPTEIHNQIIDEALPGLTEIERGNIKAGSYSVDFPETVLESHAHEHAMRRPGQNKADAENQMWDFINASDAKAQAMQSYWDQIWGEGFHLNSLTQFGVSIHPIMDNTSPAHEGFQLYETPDLTGVPIFDALILIKYGLEQQQHRKTEAAISTEQKDRAVRAVRQHFLRVYGQKRYDQATKPNTPVKQKADRGERHKYGVSSGDLAYRPNWR